MLFFNTSGEISEDGTKPLKSFCFESNLGVALKALKNYSFPQIQ